MLMFNFQYLDNGFIDGIFELFFLLYEQYFFYPFYCNRTLMNSLVVAYTNFNTPLELLNYHNIYNIPHGKVYIEFFWISSGSSLPFLF